MDEINADLLALIEAHEGCKLKPYVCPAGKLTIGIGRNIEDNGISRLEAEYLLHNDLVRVVKELRAAFPWYDELTERRKHALIDMCFNMGITTLKTFKRTLAAMERGDWQAAKNYALESKWARQVGGRAIKVTGMFL